MASVGVAVAILLLATMTACGYWLMRTQRQALTRSRMQQIEMAADLLGRGGERMLAGGELTRVRAEMIEAAAKYHLSRCRIVTPTGDVLAAGEASRITANLNHTQFDDDASASNADSMPRHASAATPAVSAQAHIPLSPAPQRHDNTITIRRPMVIAGYGPATLDIAAPVDLDGRYFSQARVGVALIGAASLLALLLVYRRFRNRLKAVGVIREALLELDGGQTPESALQIADDLGLEARAWNKVICEQQRLRRLAAVHETRATSDSPTPAQDDLARACDAMAQGVLLVDEEGQVTYANNAAALFVAADRAELPGRSLDEVIENPRVRESLTAAVTSARRATHLVDLRDQNGAGMLRYSVRPMRGGDAPNAMLVIEDVTQQRVAEEARHEFVARATHELRAPLTNIRLYLETLLADADDDEQAGGGAAADPAQRAQCLNVINQETNRLDRMVSDMLSVAEIEAGALQIDRDDVRMDEMLRTIEQDYLEQAQQKGLTLEVKLPPKLPVIPGDQAKLMLAIQNVVGNAIKYTPQGGRVTVSSDVTGGSVVVEVTDNGIGINPAEAERIFEKFYRGQNIRNSHITGSGLGLALAREVARLHGGELTLHSRADEGSTFTFSLPAPLELAAAA